MISKTSSNRSRISEKMFNEATELASLEVELAFADRKGIDKIERILLEEKVAKKRAVLGVYEKWSSCKKEQPTTSNNSLSSIPAPESRLVSSNHPTPPTEPKPSLLRRSPRVSSTYY